MKQKLKDILKNKNKTIPILSFPVTQILNITVNELVSSSELQLKAMKKLAENCDTGAVLNMMDLSVEAEAFGAKIRFVENEVPTVDEGIIDDISEASEIKVPEIGTGRTNIFIDGIRKAKQEIKDKPVFCGVIGPYSLAGRLFDMTELMMECFDSPEDVEILVTKTTEFIIEYIKAFKSAGADGVIIAEPAAGLLSPTLADEFSMPFVRKIIEETSDDDFIICYHNCGDAVGNMLSSIETLNADIYHFGNSTNLKNALTKMSSSCVIMGNLNPVLLKNGTPDEIKAELERIFDDCKDFENFMLSTGCDVPADAKWENINAYFEKVNELYAKS